MSSRHQRADTIVTTVADIVDGLLPSLLGRALGDGIHGGELISERLYEQGIIKRSRSKGRQHGQRQRPGGQHQQEETRWSDVEGGEGRSRGLCMHNCPIRLNYSLLYHLYSLLYNHRAGMSDLPLARIDLCLPSRARKSPADANYSFRLHTVTAFKDSESGPELGCQCDKMVVEKVSRVGGRSGVIAGVGRHQGKGWLEDADTTRRGAILV